MVVSHRLTQPQRHSCARAKVTLTYFSEVIIGMSVCTPGTERRSISSRQTSLEGTKPTKKRQGNFEILSHIWMVMCIGHSRLVLMAALPCTHILLGAQMGPQSLSPSSEAQICEGTIHPSEHLGPLYELSRKGCRDP